MRRSEIEIVNGTDDGFDFDARYQNADGAKVAYRVMGWPKKWECYTTLMIGENGEEWEEETGEGEWIADRSGPVVVVMVGDDYYHTMDRSQLVKIDDLDYCAECGQIGCTHDGRERE